MKERDRRESSQVGVAEKKLTRNVGSNFILEMSCHVGLQRCHTGADGGQSWPSEMVLPVNSSPCPLAPPASSLSVIGARNPGFCDRKEINKDTVTQRPMNTSTFLSGQFSLL